MKTVYSSANFLVVEHYKNVLESHGISCLIKNRILSSAAGELPPTDTWPEICVFKDDDVSRALEIINLENTLNELPCPQWRCENCGEMLDGQFAQCWQCGGIRSPS